MSEVDGDYPFLQDWERQQAEPLADFGASLFGKTNPSPYAIDRLPERAIETEYQSRQHPLTGLGQD